MSKHHLSLDAQTIFQAGVDAVEPGAAVRRHVAVREASHPVPDEEGVRAAGDLAALLATTGLCDPRDQRHPQAPVAARPAQHAGVAHAVRRGGDPLDAIASGPTVPDPTTYQDCLDIVERYGLEGMMPAAALRLLQAGGRSGTPETPKPGDPAFERTQNLVVGTPRRPRAR